MKIAVIIPFRDRGIDPLRSANLKRVVDQWEGFGQPITVIDDGRGRHAQFNRSAAYNRGVAAHPRAEAFVFAESDMLVEYDQVNEALALAIHTPGLVVPFTLYRYLCPEDSQLVRTYHRLPEDCTPDHVMEGGSSIGALNVLSRETFDAIGQFDEGFEGNWYDDNATKRAFDVCCGPTRWVDGPAHHLYHLPGHKGDHITDADRAATEANRQRYQQYLKARTPEQVRLLTGGSR